MGEAYISTPLGGTMGPQPIGSYTFECTVTISSWNVSGSSQPNSITFPKNCKYCIISGATSGTLYPGDSVSFSIQAPTGNCGFDLSITSSGASCRSNGSSNANGGSSTAKGVVTVIPYA